jgi:3-oxoacyl-[acyl-carrier-protein] synthase II
VTAIVAWSVHLPGADPAELGLPPADAVSPDAVPPDRAHELLGRKGLLYKDDATRLALCAAHRALGREPKAPKPTGPADPATAVVVSSNLGNVAVVRDVVETVRAGSGRDVSPMQAPNASSNVIASTLAIWFRFAGPNLTICSGATAGLDAIAAATLLLRAGRAERVLVVGVEPADPVAESLHRNRSDHTGPLLAGAACVIVERSGTGPTLGRVTSFDPDRDPVAGPVIRPSAAGRGDTYGADGVLGVAIAAALADRDRTVVAGDRASGWRRVLVGAAP